MASGIQGRQLRTIDFGIQISRATAAITAVSTKPLFTVSGGLVLLTSVVGVVTTAIQAQANNIKLVATPTVGAVNDLTGVYDATAGLAAGGLLGVTGLAADVLVASTGGGVSNVRNPVAVNVGVIGLNTSASSTGSVRWVLTYIPLEDGAAVTAV